MKKVQIQQLNGLGDILFLQKMGQILLKNNYQVYWPVCNVGDCRYQWVSDYIIHENLHWHESPNPENTIYLNCQSKPMDCIRPRIETKYGIFESDHNGTFNDEITNMTKDSWSDYINITYNNNKCDELFYNVLSLNDYEDYIFVNKHFARNKTYDNVYNSITNNKLKIVEMSIINGFTMFDWKKVIEKAKEIHTVDTSINYLIETLDLKAEVMKLHGRHPTHSKECLGEIFYDKWDWV